MTDISIRTVRGPNTQSLAMATADQMSIFGNGTKDFPLNAVGTIGDLEGVFFSSLPLVPLAGMPVVSAGAGRFAPASAAVGGNAAVIGLIATVDPVTLAITVRTQGGLTLPTAQWNAVTGQAGGLTSGLGYFASDIVLGGLTTAPSGATGVSIAAVGVAFSLTVMILATPAMPIVNP
jgi:hypothetical protein